MSEILFNRNVILEAGVPGTQGLRWTENRIAFKVEKKVTKTTNEAQIELFNPNEQSVAAFQAPGVIVRLFAGYEFPKQIFQGDPINNGVNLERSSEDRVLKIEAQDGGRLLESAQVNETFTTATDLSQVLQRLSDNFGFEVGNLRGAENIEFPNGINLNGKMDLVLDRLGSMSNADWSIQDGALQMVKDNGDTGEPAVLFSTQNGNLKSVVRKDKGKIEMTAVLEGSIKPGRRFVVESESINGIFKAQDVSFNGDNWSSDFDVKAIGRPSPV